MLEYVSVGVLRVLECWSVSPECTCWSVECWKSVGPLTVLWRSVVSVDSKERLTAGVLGV